MYFLTIIPDNDREITAHMIRNKSEWEKIERAKASEKRKKNK